MHWVLESRRQSQQLNCLNKVGVFLPPKKKKKSRFESEKARTKNYSIMLNEMEDNYERLKRQRDCLPLSTYMIRNFTLNY